MSEINMGLRGKKGQVTIFVIVAVLILAVIGFFIYFKTDIIKPSEPSYRTSEENIQAGMESCLKNKINEGVKLIASQGGFISNPLNRSFKFEDESASSDISFLCYTNAYYQPCIVQEPLIIERARSELENYIEGDVRECFDEKMVALSNAGYTVDKNYKGFKLELVPEHVKISLDAKVRLTKNGETRNYDSTAFQVSTKLYNLASVAREIVAQESEFCNFLLVGYSLTYPENYIRKFRTSDSIAIYRIENKDSGEIFKLAVRGCVSRLGI